MKRRIFPVTALALTLAAGLSATSAFAQTKWDLAAAYPATNFHTENLVQFAADVDKASGGKLKITVHSNASLFKAPEIKRAVQGGQAQAGGRRLRHGHQKAESCATPGSKEASAGSVSTTTPAGGMPRYSLVTPEYISAASCSSPGLCPTSSRRSASRCWSARSASVPGVAS